MSVQLYEVGGSIRDEFLGLENKDRDFVAVCPSGWDSLVEWAEEELDKLFLVTPEYFTIRGIKGKEVFDIVLARKDGAYSDGRHPDSVEPGTLEDDLARRDFTMNAIARSVRTDGYDAEVIDPFGGRKDIEEGVIRCVGNPSDRIKEDSLRIVRALRFYITKGLMMDPMLLEMIRTDRFSDGNRVSNLLANVSPERLREELHKMFKSNTIKTGQVLFGDMVHFDLQSELFCEELWLKPTMEKK